MPETEVKYIPLKREEFKEFIIMDDLTGRKFTQDKQASYTLCL